MSLEVSKSMGPSTVANIKHNPTSRQINIEFHTKALFTSVSITEYIIISFQPKIIRYAVMVNVST